MKNTKDQTATKTLADLLRAANPQHVVTITYIDAEGVETIRSIEIYAIRTSDPITNDDGTVTDGPLMIHAMCRLRDAQMKTDPRVRSAERQFEIRRVVSYTVHRMDHVLVRPEPTKYVRRAPAPVPTPGMDLITYELAILDYELSYDPDDADYVPRTLLTAAGTTLAA